jgi:hypothetical protein
MAGRATKWDKRCGAKTRQGRACLRRPVTGKRRCPNHGGLSTGARTPEGLARISAAQKKRWAAVKAIG